MDPLGRDAYYQRIPPPEALLMSKIENEVMNKVEKNGAKSGSADNIDRLELLKQAGTTGSGKDHQPGGGGGKLEMTDPFKKPAGGGAQGHFELDDSSKVCRPSGSAAHESAPTSNPNHKPASGGADSSHGEAAKHKLQGSVNKSLSF
jgi:hypothetical protein